MKRPAFQFYPADYRNNANLRRCSWAARGAWIEIMGLMHDSDEYGVLRWPLKDIALSLGAPLSLVKELATKEVLKGTDKGDCEAFIYTPIHAGKAGTPVTLIAIGPGPIWYSSRMVRDEYVRSKRGFGAGLGQPNPTPKATPNPDIGWPPIPPIGDRATTASSSSTSLNPISVDTPHKALSPGEVSKLLRARGVECQPGQPQIIAMSEQGIAAETLEAAADEAKAARERKGDSARITAGFITSILERWANTSTNIAGAAKPGSRPLTTAADYEGL